VLHLQYRVESQHKHDCYYWSLYASHHDAGHLQSMGRNPWVEANSSLLLSSNFILFVAPFLFFVLGSAVYTLPPYSLTSSDPLCVGFSFQQLWLLPVFLQCLCSSLPSLLPLWGCVYWSQQYIVQLLSVALHCTAKNAASSKRRNCKHNGM